MDPINKDGLEVTRLTSSTSDDAEWVGGFFAHGGDGAESSTVIWFAIPPGKRSVAIRHRRGDAVHPRGGELLGLGLEPVRAGDVVVLAVGEAHDLHNSGARTSR